MRESSLEISLRMSHDGHATIYPARASLLTLTQIHQMSLHRALTPYRAPQTWGTCSLQSLSQIRSVRQDQSCCSQQKWLHLQHHTWGRWAKDA